MTDGTLPAAEDEPTVGTEVLVGVESFGAGATGLGWSNAAAAVTELTEVIDESPSAEPSHHASSAARLRGWFIHPPDWIDVTCVGHGGNLSFDSYRRLTASGLHPVL